MATLSTNAAIMGESPARGTSLALSQDNKSAAAPSPSITAKVARYESSLQTQ